MTRRYQSSLNETRHSPDREGIASQGIGPSVTIPPKREVGRASPGTTTIDVVQHRFNSGHVTVGNAESKKLLGDNPRRRHLTIQNTGAVQIRISFGTTASATFGTIIYAGESQTFESGVVPNNSVYVYAPGATEIDFIEGSTAWKNYP
jgi:hypothetical protein